MSLTEAAEIMSDADDNCNAAIDFEEFKSYCRRIDGYSKLTEPKSVLAEGEEEKPVVFNTITLDPAVLEKKDAELDVLKKTLLEKSAVKGETNPELKEDNSEKVETGEQKKDEEMDEPKVETQNEDKTADNTVKDEHEQEKEEIAIEMEVEVDQDKILKIKMTRIMDLS